MDALPVRYREYRPDASLGRALQCAWTSSVNADCNDFMVVPDGCMDLLYSPETGLQLVGAMTVQQTFGLPAGTRITGLRFRPAMAPALFGLDAAELTDLQVPLADLWGHRADELAGRLAGIGDLAGRQQLLQQAFRPLAPVQETADTPFHRAIAALEQAHGDLSLDWLALHCHLSPRQFRRRCLAATGLTPKLLARTFRLQRALRLRQQFGPRRWAHIAAACGYADQAHFTRDFQSLVGCSPAAYAERLGDVRFLQALSYAEALQLVAE